MEYERLFSETQMPGEDIIIHQDPSILVKYRILCENQSGDTPSASDCMPDQCIFLQTFILWHAEAFRGRKKLVSVQPIHFLVLDSLHENEKSHIIYMQILINDNLNQKH